MKTVHIKFVKRKGKGRRKVTTCGERSKTTAVTLAPNIFEEGFFVAPVSDPIAKIYVPLQKYIDHPGKAIKEDLAKVIQKYWSKIPEKIKTSGYAYRIWIFNLAKAKTVVAYLRANKDINISASSFLSFTTKIPTGDRALSNFWSVFRSSSMAPGFIVIVQKHAYRKGFSITEFFKHLWKADYLMDEEDIDEDDKSIYYDQIDEDDIKLLNEEQEILVFDNSHVIENKEIVSMRVAVPANYKKRDGLALKFVQGIKLVEADSIDDITEIMRDLKIHV